MRLLRQLSRRKLRTALTIGGITIGIWALVVFSSMANKINALVDGGTEFLMGKVQVTDGSNIGAGVGVAPMRPDVLDELRRIDGVAAVVPQVQMLLPVESGVRMGAAESLVGAVAGADEDHETFELVPAEGRVLAPDDEGKHVVVLGSVLADKLGGRVGELVDLFGVPFTVVGVLETTLTSPDYTAYVPLAAAQDIMAAGLPAPIRDAIDKDRLISQVTTYPAVGVSDDELAARIEAAIGDVRTLTSATYGQLYGSSAGILNSILVGVGVISLAVGGLSVVNTMAMSVAERTREIGIKRAIGGTRWRIVRELVFEAGVIGLIGGLLGLSLGALVVVVVNESGRAAGTVLFQLTPATAVFAVGFSVVLGMIAGLIPAWGAARLDPVQALRYE